MDSALLTQLVDALGRVQQGDFQVRLPQNSSSEGADEVADRFNKVVEQLERRNQDLIRIAQIVGREGELTERLDVTDHPGEWGGGVRAVNALIDDLGRPTTEIARVIVAVADGDLSQKMALQIDGQPMRGEFARIGRTVNTMVDQLSSFADEVTRVAREVGTEGKLGGQAKVTGVSGTWRDLTYNVNFMASNLTAQVRNIASVATAVAKGDLSQKITIDAQGEILELKSTMNTMVDQLSSFGDEVTRVAREVGSEGKLGGQAQVRGVSGTWKDLTENVNQLASTLTTQLRAIARVSTAVTRGDLTQRITVAAQGEVAELKDNINQMIVTLRETTKKNAEQDWLNSNMARVSGLLQGQRDLGEVCRMIMDEVTPLIEAQVGAFFLQQEGQDGTTRLRLTGSYGYVPEGHAVVFAPGEGLVGQAVAARRTIRVTSTPPGYLTVRSGLGSAPPADVVVLPVLFEGQPLGVIEFGSLSTFSELHLTFLDRLVATIGVALNTIRANQRTEELLAQSQRLALELQDQSGEMSRTNLELEEKAALLSEQNRNIEIKNQEIEMARLGLEEKAQQLALASQYKSEFLANMSHELRTPLNSLLLLARLLADNTERNLSEKQIEFARTIHNAGSDLLSLIDDILDLSKIEAGRMDVEASNVELSEISEYVERAFRPQAEEKGLKLRVDSTVDLPATVLTDAQRLQQILRNLLSNAVKFTDAGSVVLTIGLAPRGARFGVPTLDGAEHVVAFGVQDTGIGVPEEKLSLIFDEFQQADGTTSRKYGGTGLGLSISRKLAQLLGGTITVESAPGTGSTFTLYLPDVLPGLAPIRPIQLPARPAPSSTPTMRAANAPAILRQPAGPEQRVTSTTQRLDGACVLIVDDDVRNVFALTSALELHGMTVLYADNGAEGVRLITEHPEVDIVLMDAMMPDMDGNETTQAIRRIPEFVDLPIVFLTAKAMPGDREKALAAGASDYITKPVDLDDLLELMGGWVQ
ncbi:ATP-binding protein [Longispora sp. K20-0274]|uniref:ATP-binding protein n=1 Tax=Longispora sp. K20-0274 TaxID=3088255 RepID=UPI00399B1829